MRYHIIHYAAIFQSWVRELPCDNQIQYVLYFISLAAAWFSGMATSISGIYLSWNNHTLQSDQY